MSSPKTNFKNIRCCGCQKDNLTSKTARREKVNGRPTGRWSCQHCYHLFRTYGQYEKPKKRYNDTNTCEFIEIDDKRCIEKLYSKNARQFIIDGKLVWFCKRHGDIYDYSITIKPLRDRRTGNLDPDSTQAKGDNFQELTCTWRSTVSTIPVEDLNKKNDNYSIGTPIDHSPDSELGIIQTRGKCYDSCNQRWVNSNLKGEWNKIFDNMILYCASGDGRTIERIYIFPDFEVIKRTSITICKNPSNRNGRCPIEGWYEKYRVKDKEVVGKVNEIWKEIIKKNRIIGV